MSDLQTWIGRREHGDVMLDPAKAALMAATLDLETPPRPGDPLPPLWHWIYGPSAAPTAKLGPDGHAPRGDFLPPVALPRRMWAGGRFTFTTPARLGENLRRTSVIKTITEKDGRSGPLCFVTVHHEYSAPDGPRFTEEHDIVYRAASDRDAPQKAQPMPPGGATTSRTIAPSMPLLFRYSALTFNAHRIHYDQDYCRKTEGYLGCVVHGPLIATLLAALATETLGRPLASFAFRATAPLFHDHPFTIHARDTSTWAETPDGAQAMVADAT